MIGAGDQLSAGDQSVPDNHCNYFRKGAAEYRKGRGKLAWKGRGKDNEVFGSIRKIVSLKLETRTHAPALQSVVWTTRRVEVLVI